ncbi:DNA primase [Limosilactobacillus reuteri]|uniref:DNA primase n=1 Tax=Limosilactobacillus reuteri TaxID=1598 RepID=A0AB36AE23_LIMRT|nr:DNA primase [Limosilactobacillus reuteri]MCC4398162.1 DNA primase [Limosilactobacillus reuteri]MCC4409744.1 DNA primase [Limosilactobacillus reuteri]MCH5357156.1 DNA primase [Limosilactobacillus reuteri]MRG83501.1 DNA primase [Limosilactobacillus reuteri]
MAKIPRNVIDEIRNSVDIGDVIGRYVQLHQAGKNLIGLCPFHDEKTPSFSVNEEKQFFYCFGCHRSGNVFQFLMELKHIDFVDAVKEIANDSNIKIPEQYVSVPAKPSNNENRQLFDLHDKAAKLYHHILVNTPAGQVALNYLKKRGMSEELIEQFGLGYAPDQRILKPFFQQQKVDYQLLRKSGLFSEDQQGELRDRFIERIMYPIKNGQGQVIAFSGRLIDTSKTNLPKYLNSPETPIFNKRRTLFNFDVARKAARKDGRLYLFEGFMDVISAFAAGIENGIASMGTSFTEEQVAIIGRATKQLDICYDGDQPGQNAIDRAISLVNDHRPNQLQVKVVQLPAGIDPDEYVQKYGPQQFNAYLTNKEETTTEFYLRFFRNGKNLDNQNELMQYLNQALKVIAQVQAPLEEDMYLQRLASEFNLDRQTLKTQLDQLRQQLGIHNQPWIKQQPSLVRHQQFQQTSEEEHRKVKLSRTELAEQILLRYMLYDREVWMHVTSDHDFHFAHEKYQTLYLLAASYFSENGSYSTADFLDYLDESSLQGTLGQIENLNVDQEVDMRAIDDCIHMIAEQTPLAAQIADKQAQLKEANSLHNTELATQLTIELVKLLKQQQRLKTEETN